MSFRYKRHKKYSQIPPRTCFNSCSLLPFGPLPKLAPPPQQLDASTEFHTITKHKFLVETYSMILHRLAAAPKESHLTSLHPSAATMAFIPNPSVPAENTVPLRPTQHATIVLKQSAPPQKNASYTKANPSIPSPPIPEHNALLAALITDASTPTNMTGKQRFLAPIGLLTMPLMDAAWEFLTV